MHTFPLVTRANKSEESSGESFRAVLLHCEDPTYESLAGALEVLIRFIESNFGNDALLATEITTRRVLSRRAKRNSYATSLREIRSPKTDIARRIREAEMRIRLSTLHGLCAEYEKFFPVPNIQNQQLLSSIWKRLIFLYTKDSEKYTVECDDLTRKTDD